MVSSIIPGATGATALGVDPRFARSPAPQPQTRPESQPTGDRVEIGAAGWRAARESVNEGLAQLREALAVGRAAQTQLIRVRDAAASGDADAFANAASELARLIEEAAAKGLRALTGKDVSVQAEPGAAPVLVAGIDLAELAPGDLDEGANAAALRSLDALQTALDRFAEAVRALEAHQGFLGAVEGAANVRTDLDADSARLLALQVRQGLDAAGAPIANVEPQAVLGLFRV